VFRSSFNPSRAVGKLCYNRSSSGGENSSSEAARIVEVKWDGRLRMMFDSQADALVGRSAAADDADAKE
jgi:hypothetical protein